MAVTGLLLKLEVSSIVSYFMSMSSAGQGAGRVCHMIVSQEILILPNLLIVSTIVS